jgi:Spy/CpxP family protein refolding chaperone
MKKAIIALGLVMVMLLGVAYVYAQDPGAGPRHGWMHDREHRDQWKKLNLTLEQKAKFQELRRKFIEENAQLIGGLMAKRLELRSLWTDPKTDSKTILAKEKELRDLQNRMKDKIVQYRLEARNFLTPEQIEKFGWMGGMDHGFGRGCRMGYGQGMGPRGMTGHGWGMDRQGMWQ